MRYFQSHLTRFAYLIPVFLLLSVNAFAQAEEPCRTAEVNARRKGVVIPQGKTSSKFEQWLKNRKWEKASRRKSEDEIVFNIPVIVHIINFGEEIGVETNISAAQVYSQITAMNLDFNRLNLDTSKTPDIFKSVAGKADFYFRPALYDTLNNLIEEPGINRYFSEDRLWTVEEIENLMPATIWNPSRYLNIWVANLSSNNIGFAYYPVGADIDGLTPDLEFSTEQIDGAVIDYRHFGSNFTGDGTFDLANRYNRGRTTTHEVGHWLGLRHTWGDDLFDCSIDDFCADTPATRANSSGIGGDCANENNSCEEVVGDLPDMLQNYMTYADDVCMNLFTVCQAERMRTVIASAVRRKSIIENTPEAPLALTAVYRASGNDILLNWAASPSNNVRSYLLERADSLGGTFKQIAVVEGTAFSDNTIASAESEKTYTYRVVAVSTKNFSMPSNQAQVTTVTSLNNFFAENKFEIYPNPAAENIWLSTKNVGVACLSISIYNLSGKLLATTLWENTNEKKEINISRFPKGLYLLNIQSENKSLRKKIVKY